jgi:hypothetical protein
VGDQVANDVIASLGLDPRTIEADKIRALAANLVTNVTAGVIGGVASGGSVTGVNAAATTDQFNRQLHPKEIQWIANKAKDFAAELSVKLGRPVTELEAMQWLTMAGESNTDALNQQSAIVATGINTSEERVPSKRPTSKSVLRNAFLSRRSRLIPHAK